MESLHLVLSEPLCVLDAFLEDHDLLPYSRILGLLVTESKFGSLENLDVVL